MVTFARQQAQKASGLTIAAPTPAATTTTKTSTTTQGTQNGQPGTFDGAGNFTPNPPAVAGTGGAATTPTTPTPDGSTDGSTGGAAAGGDATSKDASTTPAYYPRKVGSSDPVLQTAQDNLNPTAVESEDDIFKRLYNKSSDLTAAINDKFLATMAGIARFSKVATGGINANAAAGGLSNSPEAYAGMADVADQANTKQTQALSEREASTGALIKDLREASRTIFTDERAHQEGLSKDYIANVKAKGLDTIKALALQGVPLDKIKQSSPSDFSLLLDAFNGDENAMRANYISNVPKKLVIGDPIVVGHKISFITQDPITGAHSTEVIDNPAGQPFTKDDVKVVPNMGIFVRDINDPTGQTWSNIGGANPYYMANQQATLEGKQQMITARKALTATRLIGAQIKTDGAIQNFLKIQPLMAQVQTASEEIGKGNLNEETAARMLDTITRLNTGGQAITEGQIDLTKESQSYLDQAKVLQQKISGSGGIIDAKVAKDMASLAQKTYDLFEKQYQQHVSVYNNRLKNVNGEDLTSYSPLTDISNLPAVVDGSYASGQEAVVNSTQTNDATTIDDYINSLDLSSTTQ